MSEYTKNKTIADIIPKCLVIAEEDDLVKLVMFHKSISNYFRNVKDYGNIIKEIAAHILRHKNGETNNINILLLVGLENPSIQHAELSKRTLVKVLLSETGEDKVNDKMNVAVSRIMSSLPIDVREKISPNMKNELMTIHKNVEEFDDTLEVNQDDSNNIMSNKIVNLISSIIKKKKSKKLNNKITVSEKYAFSDNHIVYHINNDKSLIALHIKEEEPKEEPKEETDDKIGGMTKLEFGIMITMIILIAGLLIILLYKFITNKKETTKLNNNILNNINNIARNNSNNNSNNNNINSNAHRQKQINSIKSYINNKGKNRKMK